MAPQAISAEGSRYPSAMQLTRLLLGSFVLSGSIALAQTGPSTLMPGDSRTTTTVTVAKHKKKKHSRFFAPRKAKAATFKRGKVKHSARYEFYERVEKAAKEKQKIMRKLAKSQYSDPSYFGHKKKPKRRPPHKMRFCDECHIRH
jgi:hypothetical protein